MKQIYTEHLKLNIKFGRTRKKLNRTLIKLPSFLSNLPNIPNTCNYGNNISALKNVYLNDQLGDCVIAGGYHILGVETGNRFIATKDQILKDYGAIGGYVINDPSTDNGCNEQDALNYWQKVGFANGDKISGWISINTNSTQIKSSIYLFENLLFGIELPDEWINPFPSTDNFIWDVAGNPDPENGHCVIGYGYNDVGVQISSWGLTGTITWKAITKYCNPNVYGELYTILTKDQLIKAQNKAPNGLLWNDLVASFNSMGGHVIPDNTNIVTLAQAQQWATAKLNSYKQNSITKIAAMKMVSDSLAEKWPSSK